MKRIFFIFRWLVLFGLKLPVLELYDGVKGKKFDSMWWPVGAALMVPLLIFGIAGCGKKTMTQTEMYIAPVLQPNEEYWIADFKAEKNLILADPYMNKDITGLPPSRSWLAIHYPETGQGDAKNFLIGFRITKSDGIYLRLIIPTSFNPKANDKLAVWDHGGQRAFNMHADRLFVSKGHKKANPYEEKYGKFFTTVGEADLKLIRKGSIDWVITEQELSAYAKKIYEEILKIRAKYPGIIIGTPLIPELKKLIEKGRDADWLIEQFGSNWGALVTYPILSPVAYGTYIFVAKAFNITGKWWEEDLNKLGYLKRITDADDVANIINLERELYPVKTTPKAVDPYKVPIAEKTRGTLHQACRYAKSVGEYNDCANELGAQERQKSIKTNCRAIEINTKNGFDGDDQREYYSQNCKPSSQP